MPKKNYRNKKPDPNKFAGWNKKETKTVKRDSPERVSKLVENSAKHDPDFRRFLAAGRKEVRQDVSKRRLERIQELEAKPKLTKEEQSELRVLKSKTGA